MSDTSIRLAKRVAEMIPCSRAEAEQYIAGGWITPTQPDSPRSPTQRYRLTARARRWLDNSGQMP